METLVLMGLVLNPILAVVFCLNLISIIKKANQEKKVSTQKNTVWVTISFAYIIFSLTWSFAMIPY
ncbi:hypothetical protein CXF77_12640 (plasmid) [Planococcus sp. MB-3u-09]|nr:hypothetical protein CW734_01005 [Planococcus sp. MB-3u-03]PKG48709.1 hypothetical protein CXF66_00200 [Planococcus sp. Urea-trap-24]PKG90856.1 hypothetical protein CXF91_03500 [Planococcus sp. Urea-3u-39]PKH38149.1 hypothetical protein CXF77_12640 [Planococcus sp. MB-3u-09]